MENIRWQHNMNMVISPHVRQLPNTPPEYKKKTPKAKRCWCVLVVRHVMLMENSDRQTLSARSDVLHIKISVNVGRYSQSVSHTALARDKRYRDRQNIATQSHQRHACHVKRFNDPTSGAMLYVGGLQHQMAKLI